MLDRATLEAQARDTLVPGILANLERRSGRARAELLLYVAAVMEGRLRQGEVSGLALIDAEPRYMTEYAIGLLRAEARDLRERGRER
jgi:hypothetical protein